MKDAKTIEVLDTGQGTLFQPPDPEAHRAFIRDHKPKGLVSKLMTEQDAIGKLVQDGDYMVLDCNMFQRGPSSLVREIIRQKKRNLGLAGKFIYMDTSLLAAGGCLNRIDVGYIGVGLEPVTRALANGSIKLTEWSNSAITMRMMAGSMGIPFIAVRFLGGSDCFKYSAAKLIRDPFTGKETVLLPALNPDVAIVHVHQADKYGNSRIFGSNVCPAEAAASSKKVIISAEEIIDTEDIRRNPGNTTIPYYLVDAVVEAPFGCYPGEVQGVYLQDMDYIIKLVAAASSKVDTAMTKYLEEDIYGVSSQKEFLEKRVGLSRLMELKRQADIKEGYHL